MKAGISVGMMAAVCVSALGALPRHEGPEWRQIEQGASRTVRLFYQQLLSEQCSAECGQLLAGASVFWNAMPAKTRTSLKAQAPNEALWEYLRQNKRLFLLAGLQDVADASDIRLRYVVRSLDSQTWKDDSSLGVVAFHVLSIGGTQGVFKEVFFPLEHARDSATGYRINLPGVRVNGIGLDPEENRDRSGDLYALLGFRSGQLDEIGRQ